MKSKFITLVHPKRNFEIRTPDHLEISGIKDLMKKGWQKKASSSLKKSR